MKGFSYAHEFPDRVGKTSYKSRALPVRVGRPQQDYDAEFHAASQLPLNSSSVTNRSILVPVDEYESNAQILASLQRGDPLSHAQDRVPNVLRRTIKTPSRSEGAWQPSSPAGPAQDEIHSDAAFPLPSSTYAGSVYPPSLSIVVSAGGGNNTLSYIQERHLAPQVTNSHLIHGIPINSKMLEHYIPRRHEAIQHRRDPAASDVVSQSPSASPSRSQRYGLSSHAATIPPGRRDRLEEDSATLVGADWYKKQTLQAIRNYDPLAKLGLGGVASPLQLRRNVIQSAHEILALEMVQLKEAWSASFPNDGSEGGANLHNVVDTDSTPSHDGGGVAPPTVALYHAKSGTSGPTLRQNLILYHESRPQQPTFLTDGVVADGAGRGHQQMFSEEDEQPTTPDTQLPFLFRHLGPTLDDPRCTPLLFHPDKQQQQQRQSQHGAVSEQVSSILKFDFIVMSKIVAHAAEAFLRTNTALTTRLPITAPKHEELRQLVQQEMLRASVTFGRRFEEPSIFGDGEFKRVTLPRMIEIEEMVEGP